MENKFGFDNSSMDRNIVTGEPIVISEAPTTFGELQDFGDTSAAEVNYLEQTETELELADIQAMLIKVFGSDSLLLKACNRSMSSKNLNTVAAMVEKTSGYQLDMADLYANNSNLQEFLNLVVTGAIVTSGIEKTIPNTNKVYFVTASEKDSVHYRKNNRVSTFKSLVAIEAYDRDIMNNLEKYIGGSINKTDKDFASFMSLKAASQVHVPIEGAYKQEFMADLEKTTSVNSTNPEDIAAEQIDALLK